MIKKIKKQVHSAFFKSEFNSNVFTLMMGSTLAQAIPIAITPILTRLYTPEDFGVLALFIAITSILGSVATGQYEQAIILPKKEEDAIHIAALSLLIALCFSIFLLIIVIFLSAQITSLIDDQEITFWLYFVPLVVLITGLFNVLNYLHTRKKLYKDLSKIMIYRSTMGATAQISIGLLKTGATGLITGQILSHLVANIRLMSNVRREYVDIKLNLKKIKQVSKRYKNFFLYSIIGTLSNTSAQYIVNILITSIYNFTTLGFFYLAQRVLVIPSMVVGSSFSQVFYEAATKEKQKKGSATQIYKKTLLKLSLLSAFFFPPVYFFAEDVFAFFLGDKWKASGKIAVLLLPLIVAQFIASTLAMIFFVFERQRILLIWQILLLISSIIIILVSFWLDLAFLDFITLYSWLTAILYILYIFISYKIAQNNSYAK
jgi:O-antigen/teichoic acid export membrane protein